MPLVEVPDGDLGRAARLDTQKGRELPVRHQHEREDAQVGLVLDVRSLFLEIDAGHGEGVRVIAVIDVAQEDGDLVADLEFEKIRVFLPDERTVRVRRIVLPLDDVHVRELFQLGVHVHPDHRAEGVLELALVAVVHHCAELHAARVLDLVLVQIPRKLVRDICVGKIIRRKAVVSIESRIGRDVVVPEEGLAQKAAPTELGVLRERGRKEEREAGE